MLMVFHFVLFQLFQPHWYFKMLFKEIHISSHSTLYVAASFEKANYNFLK